MEYQKKAGQKLWKVVDFVKNASLMCLYRDVSEVMNKAGLYNNQLYPKENDKEKHFIKIIDLLEEQEFPENWFENKFDRMDEVIETIVELLEIDAEQFELYVRAFGDKVENDCGYDEPFKQVWYKEKKVVVEESESESDSDGDEDSGQGAVEDSDDEDEGTNGEFCGKCENYRYQYDILESKEKWEKRIKSYGATPCECEKEEEEDDCYDEDMCDKCSKGLKMPNKYGSCECVCKCGEMFWECRYRCDM